MFTEEVECPRPFTYYSGTEEVMHVVVVDSHEAMREGLRQMLNGDENIRVIGEAKDCKEALNQVQSLCPEIIVVDVATAVRSLDGIKIINQLKQLSQHAGVIVLSDENDALIPAIENGASGFLTRDITRNELIAAVRITYTWRSVLFGEGNHFVLVRL